MFSPGPKKTIFFAKIVGKHAATFFGNFPLIYI